MNVENKIHKMLKKYKLFKNHVTRREFFQYPLNVIINTFIESNEMEVYSKYFNLNPICTLISETFG
jgi:hypothetical protein